MKLSTPVQPSKCKAITGLLITEFQYATRRFLDRQIELQKDLP